ncbi:dCTP deaminase [Candidatus Hecatella orcuttiae]|uniref:dCTP deaminase n=1 Tax=Candidatus Hecatella orcuttiae TaxID=1935119 RepID=UPI002867C723|nr:dCTP deaminase [Candidatus Hecatella orcuttiae]
MILSDFDLLNYIRERRLVIRPFKKDTLRENGVDLHLGDTIARLRPSSRILDTRGTPGIEGFYSVEKAKAFTIQPNEKVLVSTLEHVEIPSDLMGFVELRSTFARCGILLPPTILDGGFKGNITIEILGSAFPVRLYSGDRFAHVVFAKLTSPLGRPYDGKYQGQQGIALPRFDLASQPK